MNSPPMIDRTANQFRVASVVGIVAALTGTIGIIVVGITTMPFATAKILTQLCVMLSVIGLIVSTIALVLARKAALEFWESSRAYIAACIGIALPSALVVLHFVRILQRLLLQAT